MIEFFATPGVHSQKVRIMLEETGLPYVARATDNTAEPTFFGRSPSLRDPDGPDGLPITISESAAIALYLSRKARKFGPEGARELVAFDYWAHAITSTLSSLVAVHDHFKARDGADDTRATFEAAVRKTLHGFEEHMATRHMMVGERFTVIDALLYPHLATSVRSLDGGLSVYPNLERYRDRIAAREAVRRAMSA